MIGGQGLYSQTPGAFHMYSGAPNLVGYSDPVYGSPFAPVGRGDALASALGQVPQHLLTLGGILSLTKGLSGGRVNLLGKATTPLANMLGFHGMGMVGGMGAHLLAGQVASSFAAGIGQQQDAQRALNQVFGSRDLGGFMGFGASREDANQLAGVMRDMTRSTDLLTSDQEVKNLFQKFNKMKLMQTSRDAKDMMGRFKELVTTVRDISRDLGTTMEGVMPFFEQQVRMGFNDPQEIRRQLRLNRAARSVGIGIDDEQLIGVQQAGAAANRAVGGSGRFGAEAVRKNLLLLSTATEQGLISDQELQDMTGRRGSDAVADLAQQMTMAGRTLMQNTGQGRMLAGILGETDESGRFTGRIDRAALNRLRGMSYDEMQREFERKVSTSSGLMSFEAQMQSGMGANMTAELGGDFNKILDVIFQREGAEGRDAQQIILKQLVPSLRGDVARKILEVYERGEGLQQQVDRELRESSVRNRLPSIIEENFSFGSRLSRGARMVGDALISPIERAGASAGQSIGEYSDEVAQAFMTGGISQGVGEIFLNPFRDARRADSSIADLINMQVRNGAIQQSLSAEDIQRNIGANITQGTDVFGLFGTGVALNLKQARFNSLAGRQQLLTGARAGNENFQRMVGEQVQRAMSEAFEAPLAEGQVNVLQRALNAAFESGDLDISAFSSNRELRGMMFQDKTMDRAGGARLLRRALQDGQFNDIARERAEELLQALSNAQRISGAGEFKDRSSAQEMLNQFFGTSGVGIFDTDNTFGLIGDSGLLGINSEHLSAYARSGEHEKLLRILNLATNQHVKRETEGLSATDANVRALMEGMGGQGDILEGLSEEDVMALLQIRQGINTNESNQRDFSAARERVQSAIRAIRTENLTMRRRSLTRAGGFSKLSETAQGAVGAYARDGNIDAILGLGAQDVQGDSVVAEALRGARSVGDMDADQVRKALERLQIDVSGDDDVNRRALVESRLLGASMSGSERSIVGSAERFQGVARTAQLVSRVSQDVSGMLENTQRSSTQFQAATTESVQRLNAVVRELDDRIPR